MKISNSIEEKSKGYRQNKVGMVARVNGKEKKNSEQMIKEMGKSEGEESLKKTKAQKTEKQQETQGSCN